jgi:hypothetical protein
MKMLVRAVNSVASGHVSFPGRDLLEFGQRIGIRRQAVRAAQGVCFCFFPRDGDSISDSRMTASSTASHVFRPQPCISHAARRLIVARAVFSRIAGTTRASLITSFSCPSFQGRLNS